MCANNASANVVDFLIFVRIFLVAHKSAFLAATYRAAHKLALP